MNIKVMPRSDCVRYCHKPHNEKSIIVSINTPWACYETAPFGNEENKVLSILRLWFDDVDEKSTNSMNADHARAIANFVDRFSDREDLAVIVHCDAGVSRSAGVAAALSEYYNGDDSYFFDSGIYRPNILCYRTMLNELYSMPTVISGKPNIIDLRPLIK